MSAQASRPRSRLPFALLGCGVLAACGLAAGVLAAGAWIYTQNRVPASEPAVEYLLDASPRMALAAEDGTRLSVAQAVLAEIVRPADPAVTAGLRVFGTGAVPDACKDTRLVVPLAPANQPTIAAELAALIAGPAAEAAMAEAMIAAIGDLSATTGPHTLVVVTGGQDACLPEAGPLIAQEAERAGIALELFVVGYQVPAEEADAIRTMVAGAGGGAQYLEAQDAKALRDILTAIQRRVDSRGSVPIADILATARAVAALPTATPVPQVGVTLEAAGQIVVEQVVKPADLDHEAIVFAWPESLGPDDVLAPYAFPPFGLPPEPVAVPAESWFFWIDDFPTGLFEHPNRYVLVDRTTGALTVSDETWWPVLNGEGLWISYDEYWNEANWVFDNFEGQPREAARPSGPRLARLAALPAAAGMQGLGLVLNGWQPGQPGEADLMAGSQQVASAMGAAALSVVYLGPAGEVAAETGGALTADGLNAAMQQAAALAPGDTLMVYAAGHGGRGPDGTYFGAGFDMATFKRQLEALDPGVDVVVVFEGGYSGSAITSLLPPADRIITATDGDTPAALDADHPSDPDPADRGTEFTSAYSAQFAALAGDEAALTEAMQTATGTGRSHWNVLAEMAFSQTLSVDSNAVRGVTFPQMAPLGGLPIAENEAVTPGMRLAGSYEATSAYHSGNREHLCCIPMPAAFQLRVNDAPLLFEGPEPWVGMTGELNADGSFSLQRTGTVAGIPDVLVTFEGTLAADGLNGLYTFGADKKLPGGEPITFLITGRLLSAAAPPTTEKVEGFLRNFVGAQQIGLVPFLLARLDPVVLDVYGEEACRAELERRGPDPTFAVNVISVSPGLEPWVYAAEGQQITVQAYSLEVELTSDGTVYHQISHLGVVDGHLTWFTMCRPSENP
jgi:hypothetical protein